MNSAPPPARDLPPHRRAEIRAEIERAAGSSRSFRYAPLLTAGVATASVVAVVAVLQPWSGPRPDTAAPPSPTSAPVVTTGAPPTSTDAQQSVPGRPSTHVPAPWPVSGDPLPAGPAELPGLDAARITEIENGCLRSAGLSGTPVLHQYLEDAHGHFALVYTENAALSCTVDGEPAMPYNAGFSAGFAVPWLPGPFSIDASPGRILDPLGPAPVHTTGAAGRVEPNVARVTYDVDGMTAEATVANGTYVVRVTYPPGVVPDDFTTGEVRAYDEDGTLLGTSEDMGAHCWVDPEGKIVRGRTDGGEPGNCLPARRWR
ncbi:hypothetical protein [Umezawaea beigongshangensis]|uniref:hypothetical protein n=1 Tax=Umezawaea beigongshangensis TaxID=2780383 RepID=UPI0018F1ABCB|nr:hypothetical protein [Umezawaea beigongshangensis]